MFSSIRNILHWLISVPFIAVIIICYFYADRMVAEFLYHHPPVSSLNLIQSLTILGLWPLILTIIGIIYILCRMLKLKKAIRTSLFQISLSILASSLIVTLLKILFGRARPLLFFEKNLYGFYGPTMKAAFWSFPSGHSATVMAVAWSLCILYSRYVAVWLFLGLLIVASRILLMQHYLSDVVTSIYLALIIVVFVHQYRYRWEAYS